jgi:ketosteroid isomerase-like protein
MDERRGEGRVADDLIAGARAAFLAALRRGDAEAASAVYTDGARLLAPSAELFEGRAAIAAFWRAGLEAGISAVELEALELERNGSVAYEIGRYALRLQPAEGGTVVDRGKYALVHERQDDGSWLRAVEAFNPDAPPASAGGQTRGGISNE